MYIKTSVGKWINKKKRITGGTVINLDINKLLLSLCATCINKAMQRTVYHIKG